MPGIFFKDLFPVLIRFFGFALLVQDGTQAKMRQNEIGCQSDGLPALDLSPVEIVLIIQCYGFEKML